VTHIQLKNGRHIDDIVPDSLPANLYVFWVEDCFDPKTWLVGGENWEDAYGWFLCSKACEDLILQESELADYIEGEDQLEPGQVVDWAFFEKAFQDGKVSGAVTINDDGQILDTESIVGMTLAKFAEYRD
jgi:hypothetical protein